MTLLRRLEPKSLSAFGQAFYANPGAKPAGDTPSSDFEREVDIDPMGRMLDAAMDRFEVRSRAESDAWLAPRVHATLRLTPREAADPWIWRQLALIEFPAYVRWRWRPTAEDKSLAATRFTGPDMNQALSRLWWGAELTRNGASYAPTIEAFRFQDIPNTWFRLHLFHHRPAVLASLRVMSELRGGNLPGEGGYAKRTDKINRLAKAANVLAVTTALDCMAQGSADDFEALQRWTDELPDPSSYLDDEPVGPSEGPVSEQSIAEAERFVREAAAEAGLFHDQSGDD